MFWTINLRNLHLNDDAWQEYPLKWELSFTTVHDKNHWVIIEFSDDSPIEIMIGGSPLISKG